MPDKFFDCTFGKVGLRTDNGNERVSKGIWGAFESPFLFKSVPMLAHRILIRLFARITAENPICPNIGIDIPFDCACYYVLRQSWQRNDSAGVLCLTFGNMPVVRDSTPDIQNTVSDVSDL